MKQVAIVYWSGTGNTEQMAELLSQAVGTSGGKAELLLPDAVSSEKLAEYDAIALGCPSMGDEVLEESEFQPMYDSIQGDLAGRTVGLFGSYGWGDGQWMRDWEAEVKELGANLAGTVMANYEPDDDAAAELNALAVKLLA